MTKKKIQGKKKKTAEKRTIRCRNCFMVDSYTAEEKKCRHCGIDIYLIDAV
ncbi:MAG: hypothetical protein JW957_01200 [Candidatus Omnitrophica bacterium]|nr:hypothetical protein [Candidatus Omnitrophota bacterium]